MEDLKGTCHQWSELVQKHGSDWR